MNAYDTVVVKVERIGLPDSLVQHRVTYVNHRGDEVTRKTYPGGDVNRVIENEVVPGETKVDVILNGRHQIIAVMEHGA